MFANSSLSLSLGSSEDVRFCAGRGFTLLARLNSTSMNIQIGAERLGRGRGASGASLSLTTGQGLSGPQFEVRPMKFVEYSAFAS